MVKVVKAETAAVPLIPVRPPVKLETSVVRVEVFDESGVVLLRPVRNWRLRRKVTNGRIQAR